MNFTQKENATENNILKISTTNNTSQYKSVKFAKEILKTVKYMYLQQMDTISTKYPLLTAKTKKNHS